VKIATKLNVLLFVLVGIIATQLFYNGWRAWQADIRMTQENQLLAVAGSTSAFVHLFQIERAKGGVFIAKGDTMPDLSAHRTKVDAALSTMLTQIKTIDHEILTDKDKQIMSAALQLSERIHSLRAGVDARSLKITEWVDGATNIIKDTMATVISHFSNDDVSRSMSDLLLISQTKELAGQERALGVNTINNKKFFDNSRMILFAEIAGGQRLGLNQLGDRLQQADVKSKFDEIRSDSGATGDVRSMRKQMLDAHLSGQEIIIDVTYWFEKTTQRINALNELGNLLLAKVNQRQSVHVQDAQQQVWLAVVFTVLLLILILAVNYFIVFKGIRKPLHDMIEQVTHIVAAGKFDARIGYSAADELGDAARAINLMLSATANAIDEINQSVAALSAGKFDQRMTRTYTGDLATLQQNLNSSIDTISAVMGNLSNVMTQLQAGNFNAPISEQGEGAYKQMLRTARVAMDQVNTIMNDVMHVMALMSEGDFNQRVNANAVGDLATLKNNNNDSMHAIATAINAINDVVAAQAMGDFTKLLPAGSFKGQLHDLKNAINYSADKVKDAIAQAVQSASVVKDASSQVSQGASDLSARVQEQAAALEQTSATMHEMTAAVEANTANARRVADLAHQVERQSDAGVGVMQQTIGAMQSIRDSSSKIADIVSLIDGIAFQTNLLALNAAVEAARAGEHGRGFAVVASEVRALAQKSADAAKDIKTLISDSVSRIEVGTELADKSGEMLGGITTVIKQVATMIEEIAQASNEQNIGIGQVHKAIANIDQVTQENAALVEETTAAADQLNHEAIALSSNVSFFNIGVQPSPTMQRTPASHHKTVASKPKQLAQKALPAAKKASNPNDWSEF